MPTPGVSCWYTSVSILSWLYLLLWGETQHYLWIPKTRLGLIFWMNDCQREQGVVVTTWGLTGTSAFPDLKLCRPLSLMFQFLPHLRQLFRRTHVTFSLETIPCNLECSTRCQRIVNFSPEPSYLYWVISHLLLHWVPRLMNILQIQI